MKSRLFFIAICLGVSFSLLARVDAQVPEFPKPQKEHEWLKQFTGEWTSLSKTVATPDQPSIQCSGSMQSHMLGDFWVVNRIQGDMAGMTYRGLQTIGYDAKQKKYVGTWVDSMMGHLWHYEGTIDASGKKLILIAEGPHMMDQEKVAQYRDSYEFKSPDLILATAEMKDEQGKWQTFMTGEMRREAARSPGEPSADEQ